MFSNAKKQLIEQKINEQYQLAQQRDKKKSHLKYDPRLFEKLITASIKMKAMENSFYMNCTKLCVNLGDEWLNDKERQCLNDCNKKIGSYLKIAKEQFNNTEDPYLDDQKMIQDMYSAKK